MSEHTDVLQVLERELLLACRSKGVDCEICKDRSAAINAAIASLSFTPQPVTPADQEARKLMAAGVDDDGMYQPVTPAGGEVEARAKAMFEDGTVGANSAPWEQQWEPTKEYWRAKAAHPPAADAALARHWIDRYAAGLDEELQMDRVLDALGVVNHD